MPHMGEFTKKKHAGLSTETDLHTPKLHASRHENGGADEIDLTGLSGAGMSTAEKAMSFITKNAEAGLTAETLHSALTGADLHNPKDLGEGAITILPPAYNSIGQGTWILLLDGNGYLNFLFYNQSNVDGDNVSYKVYMQAGTYTLLLMSEKDSNLGILDVDIDGVEVHSADLYSATELKFQRLVKTGIAIATTGLKTLRIRGDGKNASSSGNYILFSSISLWRTA